MKAITVLDSIRTFLGVSRSTSQPKAMAVARLLAAGLMSETSSSVGKTASLALCLAEQASRLLAKTSDRIEATPESSAATPYGLAFQSLTAYPSQPKGGESRMPVKIKVNSSESLETVELSVTALLKDIAAAATPDTGRIGSFEARLASDWGKVLFKEQWSALAIAPGLDAAERSSVLAWGHGAWPTLDDETFQVSLPALLALQRKAIVTPEGDRDSALDPGDVRAHVAGTRRGILGDGGNWRCLVEFDPEAETASVLNTGGDRRAAFMGLIRKILEQLEVGAIGRRMATRDVSPRQTVLQFLHELHVNAWEYASGTPGVRVVRLQKHLHLGRNGLVRKAGSFDQLRSYIGNQPAGGAINLVEASVSDFGPGILDGFLASAAGARYKKFDRLELLHSLLHEKLSGKANDPDAGLGIAQALSAARAMYGFVSLRTGEFWLTMDGSSGGPAVLTARPGNHPTVVGTHWQLLYPDVPGGTGTPRA